jgi:hypothetical protein
LVGQHIGKQIARKYTNLQTKHIILMPSPRVGSDYEVQVVVVIQVVVATVVVVVVVVVSICGIGIGYFPLKMKEKNI